MKQEKSRRLFDSCNRRLLKDSSHPSCSDEPLGPRRRASPKWDSDVLPVRKITYFQLLQPVSSSCTPSPNGRQRGARRGLHVRKKDFQKSNNFDSARNRKRFMVETKFSILKRRFGGSSEIPVIPAPEKKSHAR